MVNASHIHYFLIEITNNATELQFIMQVSLKTTVVHVCACVCVCVCVCVLCVCVCVHAKS